MRAPSNFKHFYIMLNNVNAANAAQTNNENAHASGANAVFEKAQSVLRARLPHLTENALNFEKRTGNFFKATTEVGDDGVEKVRRLVVEDATIPTECAPEMEAKRAAAFVVSFDAAIAKADKAIEEAQKALEEATEYRNKLNADYETAADLVIGYVLPEKAQRVSLAAKVESQQSEIDKLRALLRAAGIDPDTAE